MNKYKILLSVFLFSIFAFNVSFAHKGGLDKNGGHTNKADNKYHCHSDKCFAAKGEKRKDVEAEKKVKKQEAKADKKAKKKEAKAAKKNKKQEKKAGKKSKKKNKK
ncbi:MAG: hypothetical protein DRQ51_00605 [Gammaproteobacteria bacterium]|nr:MAG: hypothetical protein DRQ51_00605 [Gammaproteobacteria bacterium]